MGRRYDNSSRAARAEETRTRILDAVLAECAGEGELSVADIAKRAEVSEATVYRHYPNREALFEAVQEHLDERLGRPRAPKNVQEFRAAVPPLHKFFRENEQLVRTVARRPELRALWEGAHERRAGGANRSLRELTSHLPPAEATAARAMVLWTISAEAWLALRDYWNLPGDVIEKTATWAMESLLDRLERDREEQDDANE